MARILQRFINGISSRTTERPSDTTSKRKNDNAFRPASNMATASDRGHQITIHPEVRARLFTNNEEYGRCCSWPVSVEIAVVCCIGEKTQLSDGDYTWCQVISHPSWQAFLRLAIPLTQICTPGDGSTESASIRRYSAYQLTQRTCIGNISSLCL